MNNHPLTSFILTYPHHCYLSPLLSIPIPILTTPIPQSTSRNLRGRSRPSVQPIKYKGSSARNSPSPPRVNVTTNTGSNPEKDNKNKPEKEKGKEKEKEMEKVKEKGNETKMESTVVANSSISNDGGTGTIVGGDINSLGSLERDVGVGVPRLLSSSGKSGISSCSVSVQSDLNESLEIGDGKRQSTSSSSQRPRLSSNLFSHHSNSNNNSNNENSMHSISPLASPNGSFIQASVMSELELDGNEEIVGTSQLPDDELKQDWRGFTRDDLGQRQGKDRDGTISPASEFGDEWQEAPSPETAGVPGLDEEGSGGNECANSVSTTSENSDDGCLDAFLFSDDDSGSDCDAAGSDVSSISSQGLSYCSSTSQDTHKKVMINTAFNRGFALKRDPQDPLYSKSPIFPHQQLFSSFPIDQAPSRLILSLTDPNELKDQADDGKTPELPSTSLSSLISS